MLDDDDDGVVVFESRVICKYLARRVFSQSFAFRLGGIDEGRKELKAESEAC